MSGGPRIALAILLVAAAGPAGFIAYRFLAAEHLIAAPHVTLASGDQGSPPTALRPESAPRSGPAPGAMGSAGVAPHAPIPETLPDVTLPDATSGTPRALSSWRGRPLIVNFWATWCEPCRREIPLLESLRHRATDHLEVVGIAVDDHDPVLRYMHHMGVDYPVLVGGEERGTAAIEAFGMQAVLPFSVFADTRGRIVAVKVGELHPDDARLILARLADVDAGRMLLQQARDRISTGLAALAAARAREEAAPPAAASPAAAPPSDAPQDSPPTAPHTSSRT